jgi:hypothetical protein
MDTRASQPKVFNNFKSLSLVVSTYQKVHQESEPDAVVSLDGLGNHRAGTLLEAAGWARNVTWASNVTQSGRFGGWGAGGPSGGGNETPPPPTEVVSGAFGVDAPASNPGRFLTRGENAPYTTRGVPAIFRV